MMSRIQKSLAEIESHLQALVERSKPQLSEGSEEPEGTGAAANLADTAALELPPEPPGDAPPKDAFLIVDGIETFPLSGTVVNLGRKPDNDLVLDDVRVSRTHAQLRAVRGRYVVFDLGSTGGTFVNSQRIAQSATLFPGDVISLAGVTLIFGQDSPTSRETTREIITQ